jgi:hypothetical protein
LRTSSPLNGSIILVVRLSVRLQEKPLCGLYCKALVAKYEQYLDQSSKKGQQPQSVDAQAGVAKCKAGDPAGIPAIEKALKDAKFDLPSRG